MCGAGRVRCAQNLCNISKSFLYLCVWHLYAHVNPAIAETSAGGLLMAVAALAMATMEAMVAVCVCVFWFRVQANFRETWGALVEVDVNNWLNTRPMLTWPVFRTSTVNITSKRNRIRELWNSETLAFWNKINVKFFPQSTYYSYHLSTIIGRRWWTNPICTSSFHTMEIYYLCSNVNIIPCHVRRMKHVFNHFVQLSHVIHLIPVFIHQRNSTLMESFLNLTDTQRCSQNWHVQNVAQLLRATNCMSTGDTENYVHGKTGITFQLDRTIAAAYN